MSQSGFTYLCFKCTSPATWKVLTDNGDVYFCSKCIQEQLDKGARCSPINTMSFFKSRF